MFELARYDAERRMRSNVILGVIVGVIALFFTLLFPSFEEAGAADIADAMPPAMQEMFGVEAMGTIEGFLAVEIYNWVWVLLVGMYFAYVAAGMVARHVEHGQMDLLLSYPVSRRRVVGEKVSALAVPLVVLNVVVFAFVFAGVVMIGESVDVVRFAMVHALSVPYFLVCIGIGTLLSVAVSRAETAQRVAIGLVFVLWLTESITATVDGFEWVGALSPTNYYDPTEILVHGTYDLVGAGLLAGASVVLVVLGAFVFRRTDI